MTPMSAAADMPPLLATLPSARRKSPVPAATVPALTIAPLLSTARLVAACKRPDARFLASPLTLTCRPPDKEVRLPLLLRSRAISPMSDAADRLPLLATPPSARTASAPPAVTVPRVGHAALAVQRQVGGRLQAARRQNRHIAIDADLQATRQRGQVSADVHAHAGLGADQADAVGVHAPQRRGVQRDGGRGAFCPTRRDLPRGVVHPIWAGHHIQLVGPDTGIDLQGSGDEIDLAEIGPIQPLAQNRQAARRDIESDRPIRPPPAAVPWST